MTLWYLPDSVLSVYQFSVSSLTSEESCLNVPFLQCIQEQFLSISMRSLQYSSAALIALATFLITQILVLNYRETYWISWREMWLWKESTSVTSSILTFSVDRWHVNENGFYVFKYTAIFRPLSMYVYIYLKTHNKYPVINVLKLIIK
jgi:hypothetical protein